ncbi:MAG: acyl carrier protein [Planctomycetes bacterium]|nr:acyl carrier protein [Planctomycetota bacterium]
MSKQDVALDVLAKVSGRARADLKPEMELVADLGIDSPKGLQLLAELEDTLKIEISDEDAAAMNTVADISNYAAKLN